MDSLKELNDKHRRFVEDRDWQKHQSPKNLVIALMGEVGEVAEHFQWLTPEESWNLEGEKKHAVGEELADVLIYLTSIAAELDIDIIAAAHEKCEANARKYPAEQFKGNNKRPHERKD